MIVSAHQPAYLPWLGYFHKISLCDTFVYYEHVSHSKRDFTTRNKIKTSQGPMWLTVPVLKGEEDQISKLKINPQIPWQRQHLKSLETCYGKTPYFSKYMDQIRPFYESYDGEFSDLVFEMTKTFLEILGLNVKLIRSTDLPIDQPKNEGIFQMMEALEANKIVFGAHGRDYVLLEEYRAKNLKFYFQDYQHPVYPQAYGEFLPCMSILDLIFNCGPNSLSILTSGNILKQNIPFE